ncbi:MAG: HAD-IIB family hydrolase [Rhodobiaceae bacterium]
MRPLVELSPDVGRGLIGVFTDIDDTLTTDGQLPAASYSAMERLRENGLAVVPITGRPAGWCDLIARLWPVDGVVGENGAFYFHYDRGNRKMRRYYADDATSRRRNSERLKALGDAVLSAVPGARISADQAYRETDLAIDFCEDVAPLDESAVARIVAVLKAGGATVKVSSIHVNAWFGSYDKLTMTRHFARDVLGLDIDAVEQRFIFSGDSPNDGPMFSFFSHSVGVANVSAFADQLELPPTYITDGAGGGGFAEMVDMLIAMRGDDG